jgi:hypothetical protein
MKILVEVSDKWARNRCAYCPLHKTCSASIVGSKLDCPLANAKEAVEADIIGKCANMFTVRTDGSPVRLYAVKEDK